MALLDLLNDPAVAAAAGLLSPTPGGSFGGGLLQGLTAGGASRAANSVDQLRQMQAQLTQAQTQRIQNPPPPQARSPHFTMTPGAQGALITNSRTGQIEFKPYPEGFSGPVAYDPNVARDVNYNKQLGTGTAEQVTDPVTAAATILSENEANKQVARPKREAAVASNAAKNVMLDQAIDQAVDQSGVFTAGFVGSASSWIPGTPAYDLSNTLGSIRANIGFDKLRELKDAGGTLGQVSDRENILLQQVWGSLEQAQSPDQLKENLERVRKQVKESWSRVNNAYKSEYGVDYSGSANPPTPEGVPPEVWNAMTREERSLWQ